MLVYVTVIVYFITATTLKHQVFSHWVGSGAGSLGDVEKDRLALLANFHKSKQNPYIQRIQETDDKDLMRKICWASNFALDAVVKCVLCHFSSMLSYFPRAYQEISDDDTTPQTITAALGSMMSKLRPDRALAAVDPPRELFKSQ